MCTHLLLGELQNYKSVLNNHWLINTVSVDKENVGSHQKNIPHVQGQRRSPSKMVGGAKSSLDSSPISTRNAWRAQTEPCADQDPETPQRLSQTCLWVFECLLRRYGSAVACHRGRGSGCSRLGCGISPLGGGCHSPHHRAAKQMTHKLQNNYTKEILTLLRKF